MNDAKEMQDALLEKHESLLEMHPQAAVWFILLTIMLFCGFSAAV